MKKKAGLSFYQPKKKVNPSIFTEVFTCIIVMLIAALIAGVMVYFYGKTTSTVGSSMEPTLFSGQKILIDRLSYVVTAPQKGDIVVFLPRGNEKSHYYIKRIVAGPGDTVLVKDGVLYVNDEPSELISTMVDEAGIAAERVLLQNGQYFCIGDNPQDGEDSRQANIGPVDKKDIVGKAWLKLSYDEEKTGFLK